MIAPARLAAYDVLAETARGGFASDLLLELAANLDTRDAGLANELVLGVLRYQAQLDYLAAHYAGRSKFDEPVRIALRLGIYQLRYLDRIPSHAAVSESVELVKRARIRSASGLVNAVLRKVNRDPVEWPSEEVELSCPQWMLDRWTAQYGHDAARAIAQIALVEPHKWMRGDRVQDIGAQSVVPLAALEPGQLFLDVCAAPGNKTAQALESGVRAIACDHNFKRIQAVTGAPRVVANAERPLPFRRIFDRVLVDAPCSGTGTLARNPEIKWRLTEADFTRQASRQRRILRNAFKCLKPGGKLVYSTCSLEHEENADVARGVTEASLEREVERLPGREPGDGFYAAVFHLAR